MEVKERFSQLLLEPGEIYFEDYAAICHLPKVNPSEDKGWLRLVPDGKLRGRLKVCSKTLVFDPRDFYAPILKIPLRSCKEIRRYNHDGGSTKNLEDNQDAVISLESEMTVEVMQHNILQPYVFRREVLSYHFELIYKKADAVLPQVCQLQRASTLPPNDQNTMIQAIVRSRQHRRVFDRSFLHDLTETPVLEMHTNKVTPLVTNPGTVLLTTARLYFQPHNNIEQHPVLKIDLCHIKQIIKRRFLLRQVGLEIFTRETCGTKHLFLTFKDPAERDALYHCIIQQDSLNLDDLRQDNITYQWQARAISNYQYLVYLNSQADRSVNDLTQYPVFPWVIADYVSEKLDLSDPGTYRDLTKPVGALNEERLERLKERCQEMPEPRFLYGSHYSTPGFVLFYLVRQFPQYMLCLQNGRFDHPDRMFNSLPDTWHNVTTNPSDFKELIPEFYDTDRKPEFLQNAMGINFGVRQNGKPVADVELPPWAKCPEDVVTVMREALESEYVSSHLHHWIDLIFGYKQRGEEAEKANNLFYHLCYEGSVDLGEITDLNDRLALEVQITEFGQIPKQLLSQPHPRRSRGLGLYDGTYLCNNEKALLNGIHNGNIEEEQLQNNVNNDPFTVSCNPTSAKHFWQNVQNLTLFRESGGHRESVMWLTFTSDTQSIVSVGQDSLLKVFTIPKLNQVRSVHIGSLALSCCFPLPSNQHILVGSWDNSVYLYNLEYSQVTKLFEAHSDAVSCLHWANATLITGSWDCTVRIWSYGGGSGGPSGLNRGGHIRSELDHDAPVTCMAVHSSGTLLGVGTQDGVVTLWTLPEANIEHQIKCHAGSINALVWNPEEDRLLTCGDDGLLTIIDTSIGSKICTNSLGELIRCVVWDGRLVVAGGSSGDLIIFDMAAGQVLRRVEAHKGPITCLALAPNGQQLVSGSQDRRIILWGYGSSDNV
ncbi:protein FAN-like isoform X1 [Oratosquilla oratoria]|uniref:protein FAN-like isoform X1 n=1 Tax=Oratosquilla oratoria TaxID=337810 RepID=UPI003F75BA92